MKACQNAVATVTAVPTSAGVEELVGPAASSVPKGAGRLEASSGVEGLRHHQGFNPCGAAVRSMSARRRAASRRRAPAGPVRCGAGQAVPSKGGTPPEK